MTMRDSMRHHQRKFDYTWLQLAMQSYRCAGKERINTDDDAHPGVRHVSIKQRLLQKV